MPRIQITIVPKQIGEIWDDLLEDMLNDVTRDPTSNDVKPLAQLIPHHYYPTYNVYQGQCYKQYSSNLCGYHATFNSLCCLNMYLGLKSEYVINSGASFWKFKKKVEKFLLQIKHANKLEDKWPWRQNDILFGDFQRTYNKICTEMFDDFDIFKENHQNFTYINFTWEFQYQNLIISEQSRNELNKKINYFKNYTGQKPLIFGIMLGITCHWTVLMAFKSHGISQFWYFDSHNDKLLDLNDSQINKYIADYEIEREEMKKSKLSNFQKQKLFMSVKDSQTSIKLIVDCLQGRGSIDQYAYNQLFNVFANPIEQAALTKNQLILAQTIKDYWYNISSFFNTTFYGTSQINWGLLTQKSKQRIQDLYKISEQAKDHSVQGRKLFDLLKKHTKSKGFF